MSSYDKNTIVNSLYNGAVLSVIVIGYSMIAKSILKTNTVDLDKFNFKDVAKFAVVITASSYTQDMLVANGILPAVIMK